MSFKRMVAPLAFKTGEQLTKDLIGIGFLLSASGNSNPNIEDSILAAAIEGVAGDFRTLGLLVDWLDIHLPYVNADRLLRVLENEKNDSYLAFWASIAQRHKGDRRFASLTRKFRGKKINIFGTQSDFLIRKKGEDARFEGTCLQVPEGILRHRSSDILSPKDLTSRHVTYRYRVIMGPSYRADMWAAHELNPNISASELARSCYGSFATAWKVIHDRNLIAA